MGGAGCGEGSGDAEEKVKKTSRFLDNDFEYRIGIFDAKHDPPDL